MLQSAASLCKLQALTLIYKVHQTVDLRTRSMRVARGNPSKYAPLIYFFILASKHESLLIET